jgi:hypothetical protein
MSEKKSSIREARIGLDYVDAVLRRSGLYYAAWLSEERGDESVELSKVRTELDGDERSTLSV